MSITVKKHPEYKLKFPSFVCDFLLREDVPPPFDRMVQGYRFIAITGNSGSGKTSLLLSLLTDRRCLKKLFNNVVVVCPLTSRKSLKKDVFEDLSEEKKYESLQDIDTIYEQLRSYSGEKESSLLIIDDCQADLRDGHVANTLNKIVANRRHLKTTCVVLLQTFNRLPLSSRKLLNLLIAFRPPKREWESVGELLEFDQETTERIFKLCFPKEDTNPHRWIMVDVQHQKIFRQFDELLVSED